MRLCETTVTSKYWDSKLTTVCPILFCIEWLVIRLKWTDLVSDREKESCVVVLEVTLASRNDP